MANKEELTAYKNVLLKLQKLQAKYLGEISMDITTFIGYMYVKPCKNLTYFIFEIGNSEELLNSKYEELLLLIKSISKLAR